jgi:tRNA(adenine34) deaminase
MDIGQPADEEMMRCAIAEGRAALDEGTFPVGAVLAQGDRILERARKTAESNYLSHAEMNVFRKAFKGTPGFKRSDNDLTLYTTLEPCVMCFGTALHLPIARIVFAMEDAYGGCSAVRLDNSPPRHQSRSLRIAGGVLRAEALELFAEFLATTSEPFWVKGGAPDFQAAVRAEYDDATRA